ncbi:MAG: putative sulfate exporter family transporter [Gammaproteobacteria bacterium]|nr:putative sulfate exporter family transporter [Gammaproteobacteria bacterium]
MTVLPGLLLALVLAFAGQYLSKLIGIDLMGLPKSPISAIMMAIILGILIRNTISLPATFQPGIRFGLVRVLRLGIVLLGIRLSLGEAGAIGLQALPVIIGAVAAALIIVTFLARRMGLSGKLGTLIAVGTSICGATAIVATAPTIAAKDDEVAYSVACITLFGVIAMLLYPFAAHLIFDGDAFKSGLFLGTSVHETAQVAGAGLVYQQYYSEPQALDVATVTKLVRNLGMLLIIPLMSILYHRNHSDGTEAPKWYTMVPLFVIGFACMSLLRTVGDMSDQPFGFLDPAQWQSIVSHTKEAAELCLGIAMAAVGLGTSIKGLKDIGLRPLGAGLVAAVLVGGVSVALISVLY